MKQDTWYLLADGTHADPKDVSPGKDGVLRHKNGVPVAMRESGVPHTLGVDATLNKNVEAAAAGRQQPTTEAAAAAPAAEALQPQPASERQTPKSEEAERGKTKAKAGKAKGADYKDREMKRR